MQDELSKAVDKGAKLLDEKCPDWPYRVATFALNVVSPLYCVLAQIYGGYNAGLIELGISPENSSDYGFDLPDSERWRYEYGHKLTRLWKDQIKQRIGDD